MNAPAIVAALAARGIVLEARDGMIGSQRAAELTAAEREAVRAVKPELLAYLALPSPPTPALDPRQLHAAEGLRHLAASGALEHEQRRATIELPNGQRVRVLPAGAEHDRPGLLHLTWAELGADPLEALARVTTVTEALAVFGGRLIDGTEPARLGGAR